MKTKSNKEILKEIVDTLDESVIKDVLSRFSKEETSEDKIKRASDFMFETLKEMTCKIRGEKELVFYDKDGKWIVQQDYKRGYLYVYYYAIWKELEVILGNNYNEIQSFIKVWMETNLGWQGLTPRLLDGSIFR